MHAIRIRIGAAGRVQAIGASDEHRTTLDIRASDAVGKGVREIVVRRRETVAAEEDDVLAGGGAHEGRGLDEGPVGVVAVEEFGWVADGGEAVVCDFLKHDWGGGYRCDCVAAGAAVADAVAVDFVDDVQGAVGVFEAGRVDRAALGEGTGEGGRLGCVGAFRRVGYCGADAVFAR